MLLAPVLECGLTQLLAVVHVVEVVGKAGLPVVAALHDVLRDAGQVEAWESGHGVLRVGEPALPGDGTTVIGEHVVQG